MTKFHPSSFGKDKRVDRSSLKVLPVLRKVQQCKIVSIGELFENCGSEIVCSIEVKKEMNQNQSLRNFWDMGHRSVLCLLPVAKRYQIKRY